MKKIIFYVFCIIIFSCYSCNNKDVNNKDKEINNIETVESISLKIRENPKNSELFIKRAELYLFDDKINDAINDLTIAIKLDSLREDIYIKLAEYQLIKGDSEKSKNALEKCLSLNPKNGEAKLKLAYIYFYVQMYQKALFELEDIETYKLQTSESYFLKALIFDETEMDKEAISTLQLAIEYDNENWKAYERIGLICAGINDKRAVDYFETAIHLFPDNIEIRYNAAVVFQKFGHIDKAIATYEFVIEKEPTAKEAYENLGFIYTNNIVNYDKAIELFSKAIEIDSLDITARYNRGFVYEKQKKYAFAEADYRKCLKIVPNYELAVQGLNDVLDRK